VLPTARLIICLLVLQLLAWTCAAQTDGIDRKPAVAGQFYPAKTVELRRMLEDLFARAAPSKGLKSVDAIIVPHAGYLFSGEVAASGFNQIDASREYENIFVIGPSHHVGFEGASVYTRGNFLTPLGTVEVNRELGKRLVSENSVFNDRTDAQAAEHSVEVQLPFLQFVMKKHFRIVPLVVGATSAETCRKIAGALRPYMNGGNLFVISTDFSHYPPYDAAVRADSATAAAIMSNSPDNLVRTMNRNEQEGIPGLATSLCGSSAVLTLLEMTSREKGVRFTPVRYTNSGDSPEGGRDHVVGYWAIAVSRAGRGATEGSFGLSDVQRRMLLTLARETVEGYVMNGRRPDIDPGPLPEALKTPCGAFVTLNKHHDLRGCIGRFDATEPLYETVRDMSVAAATQDPRFSPVVPSELKELRIEISVLTPMRRITSIAEFRLGKEGIYMRKGNRTGTFLPQVAGETGWSKEEFFGHCAQDKAGIGWDGWKDAELYVYEALVFGEE